MVEPTPDVTVTMSDYKFDFSTPLTAGKHTLLLQTAPGQPHEFTFFQLMPGKTAEDAKDGKPHFAHGMIQQIKVI